MADGRTTVKELKDIVEKFVHERKWEPYHRPKNLAVSISIEAAELLEIFQWEDLDPADTKLNKRLMSEIKDEAADIMIYLLSLANSLQFDLSDAVARKMESNRKRFKL
jgi:NTP pyrophosphatase (non-canonical NTP hydrolase)